MLQVFWGQGRQPSQPQPKKLHIFGASRFIICGAHSQIGTMQEA